MDLNFEYLTLEKIAEYIKDNVDAVLVVDAEAGEFKSVFRKGIFEDLIEERGSYQKLIETLWFHFNGSSDMITDEYKVFIPSFGKFTGKYSRRLNISFNEQKYAVQMMVYPINENIYLVVLDELDNSEYMQDFLTNEKVKSIQNSYLFSMYIDLFKDETSSISVTEISDDAMNSNIKYSEWRYMIVNMIWPDDQALFMERTDPEYLKKRLAPGRTSSFDCLMQNLEGKFIWVKLTFSRAMTNNSEEDFRFVFMVQDINENAQELMNELKKYEELASKDALTEVFNHGRIETEMYNAVDNFNKKGIKASLLLLDLDFFKNVNDQFGHAVGDKTLKSFARILKEFFEDKDAAIGRWGGEEFVVVLYEPNEDEVLKQAEELRGLISVTEFKICGHITGSIGVTHITKDDTFNEAFERMDRALYKAKSDGRNCVRVL